MLIPLMTVAVCALATMPEVMGRHIQVDNVKKTSTKTHKSQGAIDPRVPHLRFRHTSPKELSVSEFGSVVLECEAFGNPPPTIHWLKDGKRVTVGAQDHLKDIKDEEAELEASLGLSMTRSRLYLDCLTPRDQAVYSCVAENAFRRETSETKLTVKTPDVTADDNDGAIVELCLSKKAFGSPARIHMWTHSRLEVEGSDILLFCRPTGVPQPRVLWVGPGDVPLTSSDKYQVMPNGDLQIKDIVWEDMGEYTCLAENERGSDKTSTFLYPTKLEKPK